MRRILRLFAIVVVLFLIAILWFWWNQPSPVDMAENAPADSMVYLEANSLAEVGTAISNSELWRSVATQIGFASGQRADRWAWLARITGLGNTSAVIASRAQVALVLLDLNALGNGDSLEFKSQAALIVETHTSSTRIKPVIDSAIGALTTRVYHQPRIERTTIDGYDFTRWIAPDGRRRIVAVVDGSVVIIGNDERAVSACLAARHGQRPSLLHNADLQDMRARLKANEALAFGYASAANTARLVAIGAPLLLGKLSEEEQLQKLLSVGAANLLGNVGWSARPFRGGIEDVYLIDLKPEVTAQLHSTFVSADQRIQGAWEFVPAGVDSVTSYGMRDPAAVWDSFNAAISSHLDVLSAVFFTTAFKAVLAPYGIDEPESFLKAIKPLILTVRLEPRSERALVIAQIANEDLLHKFVARRFGAGPRPEKAGNNELFVSGDGEFAASFAGDYFLLGSPEDVRRCLLAHSNQLVISSPAERDSLTRYLESSSNANVASYARDTERARAFINTVASIRGTGAAVSDGTLDRVVSGLPYATTETNLGSNGFERRTRSVFGQFSSLIPLLTPDSAGTRP